MARLSGLQRERTAMNLRSRRTEIDLPSFQMASSKSTSFPRIEGPLVPPAFYVGASGSRLQHLFFRAFQDALRKRGAAFARGRARRSCVAMWLVNSVIKIGGVVRILGRFQRVLHKVDSVIQI